MSSTLFSCSKDKEQGHKGQKGKKNACYHNDSRPGVRIWTKIKEQMLNTLVQPWLAIGDGRIKGQGQKGRPRFQSSLSLWSMILQSQYMITDYKCL